MIKLEAAVAGGVLLSIGSQSIWLHPADVRDLTDLATDPDGTVWKQATYEEATDGTPIVALVHRHGPTVTIAVDYAGSWTAERISASSLARTMRKVTQAGAR